MNNRSSTLTAIRSRFTTITALLGYFLDRRRWLLGPLLVFVLIGGLLLIVTGGLSYVAPFVYAIF